MFIYIDKNGNKCIKVESTDFNIGRGFSIQTNGNLPMIHNGYSAGTNSKDLSLWANNAIRQEIYEYIQKHGTDKQKQKVKNYKIDQS